MTISAPELVDLIERAKLEKTADVEKYGWRPGTPAWERAFGYLAGLNMALALVASAAPAITGKDGSAAS
jgi:hypothetical protein